VKVAFAGKGGSGKTTLASLFVRHLAGQGRPVVAIDADINQHLGEALGVSGDPPAMGAHLAEIKEYLRGGNPRIASAAAMVKTTPPGRGSRLLRLGGADPVHGLSVETPCGARLMATGPFSDDDLGVSCYHAKTGAVELYLNHLLDGPGEYVVVDCTAGAESFASGMFTRFDLTFLVAEPTRKGVGVWRQWSQYADGYDVALAVVGNKVQHEEDAAFLREHIGGGLLTCFSMNPRSGPWNRAARSTWPTSARAPARPCRCCRMRWTRRSRTGPGSPARRWNSTCGTPARGRTRLPARTWPFRSTLASP
jgi:CO dehydrogenase maturation factor